MDCRDSGYSVLMSVYHRERAEYLREAMDSIWKQTVKTDDFVLVCDGPLTASLDSVISDMQAAHPELHVIRLDKNGGLGNALNAGMPCCKNELIARMDSDDISRPDRCEKQLAVFASNPHVAIVSGTVEEFSVSTDAIRTRRVLPASQQEILKFAKKRNPFNHPCVMYRKTAVQAAGGYQDFYLLEDYYLWVRMLQAGFEGYNLSQPLLWMRAGSEMYKRRSGLKYAGSQRALFRSMRDSGFISTPEYLGAVIARSVSSMMPNGVRELAYKLLLRK